MTKPITSGLPTREELCSLLDYDERTGIFRWKVRRNGRVPAGARAGQVIDSGYRSIAVNRRYLLEHRLAWFLVHDEWAAGEIDHINRDRADNRIANLRHVTPSQNSHNRDRRVGPKDGEPGMFKRGGVWCARISFRGEEIFLGSHEDKEVMRLTRELAKDRALRGLRPQAASERVFLRVEEDMETA